MKLYEISNEYLECLNSAQQSEFPHECINDTLEGISGDFDQKADNIACLIKNLKAESKAIKEEIRSLRKRAIQKDRTIDGLLEYLQKNMILLEKRSIETARNKIVLKNNPQSVEIQNEKAFVQWAEENGEEFLKWKEPEPDKLKIKEFLKNGGSLDHAELTQTNRLEIK